MIVQNISALIFITSNKYITVLRMVRFNNKVINSGYIQLLYTCCFLCWIQFVVICDETLLHIVYGTNEIHTITEFHSLFSVYLQVYASALGEDFNRDNASYSASKAGTIYPPPFYMHGQLKLELSLKASFVYCVDLRETFCLGWVHVSTANLDNTENMVVFLYCSCGRPERSYCV